MSIVSSPVCTPNTAKSEKFKINSWLLKWMSGENSERDVVVDLPEIGAVLQAIGFKLVLVEAGQLNNQELKDEKNELTISLSCGRSGLHAVFTKQDYACNCPKTALPGKLCQEECNNEKNEICINKTDLKYDLPKMSKKTSNLTREMLYILFSLKEENENDHMEEFKTPMGILDSNIHKFAANNLESEIKSALHNMLPQSLDNEVKSADIPSSWEVDPKTSPPTMTSSPKSKSAESSGSDKEQMVVEILMEARANIEKALACLPTKNNTFTKPKVKRVSNIPKSPKTPSTPNRRHGSFEVRSTIKRSGTPKMSPKILGISTPKGIPNKLTPKLERGIFLSPKTLSLRNKEGKSPLTKLGQRLDTPRPRNESSRSPYEQSKLDKKPEVQETAIPRSHPRSLKLMGSTISKTKPTLTHSNLNKIKSSLPAFSKIPNMTYKKFKS